MLAFDPVVRYFWEGVSQDTWHEPLRRIFDCELVYLAEGRFTLVVDGVATTLSAGAIALVPPATYHESYMAPGDRAMRRCVHFDWTPGHANRPAPLQCFVGEPFDTRLVHPVPDGIADALPLVSHRAEHADVLPVLVDALDRLRVRDPLGELLLWPVLRRLLARGRQESRPRATGGKTERAVMAVKHHLDTHYREAPGYPELCELCGVSRSHLCQAFSRSIGMPPMQYLMRLRLQHAQRLLQDPALNVADIAHAVGFQDPGYFTRLFRREFGVVPTRYVATP